ncbi:type II secretion system F family protein [Aquirhabdus parva]|uniref:Type II secretion system F family protein n=1 Tax=Aquirhabdus parva TaxID=2283318 RepID=A0A345P2H0_9GAMM|nr:type II secretion system F family protein [Aquirhabdus parva]AXI01479.1 type II secretion system F family protein [Aquirhabdus parva]
MPKFHAQIVTPTGLRETRTLEADSRDTIQQQLVAEGVLVISIKNAEPLNQFQPRQRFDTVVFVHELKTLLESGLSLTESFDVLLDHRRQSIEFDTLTRIRQHLNEGLSLSQTMMLYPQHFPALLVASIAASERNGTLVAALVSYIAYDERISALRSKIYNASLYPILLVGIAMLVMLFLLMYLVPRFGAIYDGVDMKLPWASRIMLDLGSWLGHYRWLVLAAIAVGMVWIVRFIMRHGPEESLMLVLSRFGPLRRRLHIVFLSRFYRALGLLLEAGASVMQALDMAGSMLDSNGRLQLQEAKSRILQGQGLSEALHRAGLTTAVSARLLAAGDQNGEAVNMLRQSADFHDLDLTRFIEQFSRLLEPVLMMAIGLFIGLIVVLLYLPIFQLASGLQ